MKPNTLKKTEGVLIFNDKGRLVTANANAHHLFNYKDEELPGMSIDSLIQKGLTVIHQHRLENASFKIASSVDVKMKLNGVTKEGSEFPIEVRLNQFQGGDELFTVVFVTKMPNPVIGDGNPFDENEKIEPILFLILDNSMNISLVNKYGCQLLGCTEETLKGLNWFENFLPGEISHYSQATFKQDVLTGTNKNYESPVLTFMGEQHLFDWTASIISGSSGESIGTLCTGIDSGKQVNGKIDLQHVRKIGELNEQFKLNDKNQTQKLINLLTNVENINRDLQLQIHKRKETEQKLIKFQRLYDTMVRNFPDGVIGVLNREMKYVLIDGKDLNEIDLPALGLTGQNVSERQDPALAKETLSKITKAFGGESISFEVKTKDRFYHISAVPLPDEQNNINEILCVLKNVTEKNRMEEMLLQALEKEKELGELKSRFMTMACHEFKTPLTTILSSTFLLENYSAKDYESEKLVHISRIKRSVNNLTMILNAFLSLQKLEENRVKLVNTVINIPKHIADLISEVDPEKHKNRKIDYQHNGEEQNFYLDQHLLWSIVTNLISNALKYSKQSDAIQIVTEIKNSLFTIKVKDSGIGIPKDEHQHIFGRFHRARNAINFEGTGLGLHIVEKNVKLLNGSISFTSQLNDGTEFTVVLPGGQNHDAEVDLL